MIGNTLKKIEVFWVQLEFANPYLLWLLLLIPLLVAWYIMRYNKRRVNLQVSSLMWLEGLNQKSLRQRLYHLPFILRMLIIAILILVLARPQSANSRKESSKEGIDIIMTLDVSGSMRAMDLKPNRIEAVKEVANDFIDARPNDRMGMVVFASESFTRCPLTRDHRVLKELITDLELGIVDEQSTALGEGLATAVNRIKDSEAISKVIILLTDGVQNQGSIDPVSAAEMAELYGIRVYTIGAGTKGEAPYPVQGFFGQTTRMIPVDIDEPTMKEVASITGGKYFRATNKARLKEIYAEIDELETTKINVSVFENKNEEFMPLLVLAGALFLLELLLRITVFNSRP
jgi:Ca-activated chloride channel family protein